MTKEDSPTELLRIDHRVIEQVLDALENISMQIGRGVAVPRESIEEMIVFSQTFVDACHHGKEESCLFPCLERRGIPRDGPIGVMLYEHQVGREYVKKIQQQLAEYRRSESNATQLARLCLEYAAHLRQHIFKEEGILFRMGDGVMDDKDRKSSINCYERAEEEKVGRGKHEEMLKLAEKIGAPASSKSSP